MKLELRTICVAAGLALASTSAISQGQLAAFGCGSLKNAYGPFDYRTDKSKISIVDEYHFTPQIEQLKGNNPGGDLNYTLKAVPNHHRALMAMMKLGARQKVTKPSGAEFTVECYMMRAETFRPNDAMVKVIFGLHLAQSGKSKQAVAKLEEARQLDINNPNVHYNLGLAYLDLKQYDRALESAHLAYASGFPLPGLRERLKRAGKWQEPSPPSAAVRGERDAKSDGSAQPADVVDEPDNDML